MASFDSLEVPLDTDVQSGTLLQHLLREYPNAPIHAFIALVYLFAFGYFLFVVTALYVGI